MSGLRTEGSGVNRGLKKLLLIKYPIKQYYKIFFVEKQGLKEMKVLFLEKRKKNLAFKPKIRYTEFLN